MGSPRNASDHQWCFSNRDKISNMISILYVLSFFLLLIAQATGCYYFGGMACIQSSTVLIQSGAPFTNSSLPVFVQYVSCFDPPSLVKNGLYPWALCRWALWIIRSWSKDSYSLYTISNLHTMKVTGGLHDLGLQEHTNSLFTCMYNDCPKHYSAVKAVLRGHDVCYCRGVQFLIDEEACTA